MNRHCRSSMLRLSAMLGVLLIAGCSDSAKEMRFSAMPAELADCRVYYVTNSDGAAMTVVRCPLSATTAQVRSGKTTRTTVTIDGVQYAPVDK